MRLLTTILLTVAVLVPRACSAQDEYHVIPLKFDPAFAMDGNLDDWAQIANPITIGSAEQVHLGKDKWSGPEDLSAIVQFAWRSEGLYVALDVTDDRLHQTQRSNMMYKGDHVELFIDATPDADTNRETWGEGQFQFGLSPGNFKQTGDPLADVRPQVHAYQPEGGSAQGTQIAAARSLKGYVLEVLIPFDLLGLQGAKANLPIACEVALSDCDTEEPAQETYVTIGTGAWRHSRKRLQPMLLGDAEGKATPPPRTAPIRDELRMDHGSKQEVEFEPPPVPENKDAYLHFLGRIDFAKPAGFAPSLNVFLNDKPVDGTRLTNRPNISQYGIGRMQTFMTGEGLITLCYGPDFEATDKDEHYGPVDTDRACEYELRITDLLVPGVNKLRLETRQDARGQWKFVFGDISLLYKAPPPPPRERRGPPTGPIPKIAPQLAFEKVYEVTQTGPAALKVTVGPEALEVTSAFSSPDGQWRQGSCSFFEHSRRIKQSVEGITVFDTFRNLTDENLPVMQRHTVGLQGRLKKVWIGGLSPRSLSGSLARPANPTTYGITEQAGIGIMPMNDEFMVHSTNYCLDETLGLADNSLVIGPGATYTAEWMIVPTRTVDFWDFINTARRLRDANFTLPYQFAFLSARESHTDEWLTSFMSHKTPHVVCASIGYPRYKGIYAHGTAFQQVDHAIYARHNERIRRMFPNVKTAVYYHCFLEVLTDGDKIFADDRTLKPDGTQANYGKPHDKIFLPTLENKFGREIDKNVDYILGPCKADGVYWDELAYSSYQYHYGEPWDGCSGDIDPKTHRLRGLKSSVTLVSQPFRVRQIKRIMDGGKPFIANGQPHTRTVAKLNFQRFVETASISNCAKALLYSPVALGDHIGERTQQDAYRWMLKALDWGCVYNWYPERITTQYPTLAQHMFPITPMELHEGYIIGRERIITKRSGLFGWGDDSAHEVHVYDENGRELPQFEAPLVVDQGHTYTELRIPEDYSAAIIRRAAL